MTDNELLFAISEMLDNKFDSEFKPIKDDIRSVQGEIHSIQDEIHSMQDDMHSMQGEIHSMKDDMHSMQGEIHSLQDDMHSMQGEIHSMKDDMHSMQNDICSMQDDIHNMKLFQENIILPRLNTIESCYTETYDRYRNYTDKFEEIFEDVELLKEVVSEHSEILQKTS